MFHTKGGLFYRLVIVLAANIWLGLSIALMITARMGMQPWEVFHIGLASVLGTTIGRAGQLTSAVIVAITVFLLKRRAKLGTLVNMVVVGASIDMCLASGFLPTPSGLAGRVLVFTLGLLCFGVGAGCYISAEMGAGVRDEFMLGLVTLTKRTIKFIRTILEMSVLIIGWLLGGPVGIGTVITALAIGPIIELTLNVIRGRREIRTSSRSG